MTVLNSCAQYFVESLCLLLEVVPYNTEQITDGKIIIFCLYFYRKNYCRIHVVYTVFFVVKYYLL